MGDFNSRTGLLKDFFPGDEFFEHRLGLDALEQGGSIMKIFENSLTGFGVGCVKKDYAKMFEKKYQERVPTGV